MFAIENFIMCYQNSKPFFKFSNYLPYENPFPPDKIFTANNL